MVIDQCLPDFALYDAIGSHVIEVRRALRDAGYDSEIWADRIDERLAGEVNSYHRFPTGRGGALIYQMSTDSTMLPWLTKRASSGTRVASNYHNITPAPYFRRWEPRIAARLDVAREQLFQLAGIVELGLAVSAFNEMELKETGFRETVVTPLLVDLGALAEQPEARLVERLKKSGGTRWLFVGRLAPNKCQHDVVGAFALYRRLFDPRATLTLVGSPSSYRYQRAVERLASDLGVRDGLEHVSNLSTRHLISYYRAADIFVCLSEHEGFCVPLLESMSLGVPIVAYDAGAVSETLAGAGVLLESKDPLEVAVRVHNLLGDGDRLRASVAAGTTRAQEFSLASTSTQFLKAIGNWLGELSPTGQ